jgi:hypothetical protein
MSKMPLRTLTTALVLAASLPAAASVDDKTWQFDVLLDGKPIGQHTFELDQQDEQTVLESKASFDVKFLFVTAFRYRHESTEVWSNNCLASIDATTDSNGKQQFVRGRTDADRFRLERPDTSALPECVRAFAYWNPAVLESERLLNSQTGIYEEVTVISEGRESIDVAGTPIEAKRYRLATRGGDIKLWYAAEDQTWLALEAPAKGGRTLAYRPTRVPLADSDTLLAQND